MKERPILFSGEMVRAILEGRKTQTRRVIKPQPVQDPDGSWRFEKNPRSGYNSERTLRNHLPARCPYGQPGERLWVREKAKLRSIDRRRNGYVDGFELYYPADDAIGVFPGKDNHEPYTFTRFSSSIHMPRWASRINLEIVKIEVQRLHDMLRDDAKAEGVSNRWDWNAERYKQHPEHFVRGVLNPYVANYSVLWDEINGKGAWDVNPWVWVIEFKVVNDET